MTAEIAILDRFFVSLSTLMRKFVQMLNVDLEIAIFSHLKNCSYSGVDAEINIVSI